MGGLPRRCVDGRWLLGIALTILFIHPPSAISQGLPRINRFGFDGFRVLLQRSNIETLQSSIDDTFGDPERTVIVLLGDLSAASELFRELEWFISEGGAALVATDRGASARLMGVRFVKGPHHVHGENAYRGLRDCGIVRELGGHAIHAEVDSIITNRPGSLSIRSPSHVRSLAEYRTTQRKRKLIAAHENANGGRLILCGDHSIFINEMLLHGDNARLASNMAEFLCEGRTTLVFIEDGQVMPAWSLGTSLESLPLDELIAEAERRGIFDLLPKDSIVPMANAAVADFEDADGFNRYLIRPFYSVSPRSLWRVLTLGALAMLLVGFLRWLFLAPNKLPPWQWKFADTRIGADGQASRDAALTRGMCMRTLARDYFETQGVCHWALASGPRVVTSTGKRRWQRVTRRLWRLAVSEVAPNLSRLQYTRLAEGLQTLRQLQLRGQLTLEWDDATTSSLNR